MAHPRTLVDLAEPHSVQAVQATLLDILSRAFALSEEEVAWCAYRVAVLLSPYGGRPVRRIPLASLSTAARAHDARGAAPSGSAVPAIEVGVDAWAQSLTRVVASAYDLDEAEATRSRAQIRALLTDLGIGDPNRPRPARYVPRDVLLSRDA